MLFPLFYQGELMDYALPNDTLYYSRKEKELNDRLKLLLDEYELGEFDLDVEDLEDEEEPSRTSPLHSLAMRPGEPWVPLVPMRTCCR
jgi:hypothetical protein